MCACRRDLGCSSNRCLGGIGESIPFVCQDWANTKAAYRFLSNNRVSEEEILRGHFQSTRERLALENGPILILHDTTEFSYQKENAESIGLHRPPAGKYNDGRPRYHTVCGILMHSSLAVTTEGLPLGLTAIKFWSRKKFKGTNALKKKINITRMPIEQKESIRWLENMRQSIALLEQPRQSVHIGDRESDIYELFCEAQQAKTHFLVRTCVDRLAGDGGHTIADEMKNAPIRGLHDVEVRDRNGEPCKARLLVKYECVKVLPPIGKQKRYPELTPSFMRTSRNSDQSRSYRMETHHRSAGRLLRGGDRETGLVQPSMEDRSLSQDPEVGLHGGGVQTQNSRPDRKPDISLLYSELENLRDDDDQSNSSRGSARACAYTQRVPPP